MITLHRCNVRLAWASYSWPQLVTVGRWGGAQWALRNEMTDSLAFYGYMCGTNFLRVLIFAIFPATRKNKFPEITIFPAKIYSRVNILELEFARQKYSTKKSRLFNYNLSLPFRNKTVYNELTGFTQGTHTVVLFENMYFYNLHVLNNNEYIISAGYWVLSENRKN